jgi:sec-independent protein translocase protein TatC
MNDVKKYLAEYGDYLEEIRRRLYFLVIIFIIVFVIGFFLTTPFLKFFISILQIKDVLITTTSPFQIVDLAMSVGVFFAIIATLPIFVYNMYSFLRSGLLPFERKFFFLLIPVGLILFVVGFSYGFATLYYALRLIAEINVSLGVVNLWDISKFISQMMLTSALLGVIFQFPIIITFFIRMGFFEAELLKSKRRHAVVFIFVFVSLLPPTDGLSLVVMSLPLIVIYELTIKINSYGKRKYIIT